MHKEPHQRPMRSLKSRLLPKRQTSQHKLYTTRAELLDSQGSNPGTRGSLRRSTTVAPSKMPKNDANYLVKRLAHYSSMADALVGNRQQTTTNSRQTAAAQTASKTQNTKDSDLNVSDKENKTPDRNYRYIFLNFKTFFTLTMNLCLMDFCIRDFLKSHLNFNKSST